MMAEQATPATATQPAMQPFAVQAIVRFQRAFNLPVTGLFDDATQKGLKDYITKALPGFIDEKKEFAEIENGNPPQRYKITRDGSVFVKAGSAYPVAPSGKITDLENPATPLLTAIVARDASGNSDLRTGHMRTIDAAMYRSAEKLAQRAGVKTEDILAAINSCNGQGRDMREKLRAAVGPGKEYIADKHSPFFLDLLRAQRSATNPENKQFLAGNADLQRAAYANDLLYAAHGVEKNTLSDITRNNPVERQTGSLFPNTGAYEKTNIYTVMLRGSAEEIDGTLIGETGTVTREHVNEKSVERFNAAVTAAGYDLKDVSRILLDNKSGFHPPFEDLTLVFNGLGNNEGERIRNWKALYGDLADIRDSFTTTITTGRGERGTPENLSVTGAKLIEREVERANDWLTPGSVCAFTYIRGQDNTGVMNHRRDYLAMYKTYADMVEQKAGNTYNPDIATIETGIDALKTAPPSVSSATTPPAPATTIDPAPALPRR